MGATTVTHETDKLTAGEHTLTSDKMNRELDDDVDDLGEQRLSPVQPVGGLITQGFEGAVKLG